MRTASRRTAGIATCLTGIVLGLGAFATPASAGVVQEGDLTICHRTNSNANPYIVLTTDANGQNGGTDHFGEHEGPLWNPTLKKDHIEWGDVIPPSEAHPDGSEAYQDLVEAGIDFGAFVDNGCAAPEAPPVPTFDVTLDKVTTGGSAPAADTDFTFDVLCEPAEAATEVAVAPADEPLLVGDDVAQDDLCTITETGANGATSVSFAVTGGTVQSTTATSVTFSVEGAVAVVATNAYPSVENTVVTQTPTTLGTPTTLTRTEAPAQPTEVAGVQLARTGTNSTLAVAALGLVAIGAGTVLLGRDRREAAAQR